MRKEYKLKISLLRRKKTRKLIILLIFLLIAGILYNIPVSCETVENIVIEGKGSFKICQNIYGHRIDKVEFV
ncbi:hypothetical protein DRN62_03025 [Nanoarchaeota archaeon]|nr:MAG: hypothetical protein DRN62_03025 [Nanoarchaeota archaeon]